MLYGILLLLTYLRKRKIDKSFLFKRSYLYSSVLALAPVMIVGVSSIGRMGIYEFLLVIAFEVTVCFYVAKHRP